MKYYLYTDSISNDTKEIISQPIYRPCQYLLRLNKTNLRVLAYKGDGEDQWISYSYSCCINVKQRYLTTEISKEEATMILFGAKGQ